MKGKHLAILLGLVVLLGGAGYFLYKGDQSSWSASGSGAGGKVLDYPINEVAAVRIKAADSELNLTKKGEEWAVQERADYPASFEQVGSLVRKFWELKTVQEVKVGPSQMPRLELVEPGKGERSGTLVELKDKEGKILSAVLLGKKHLRKSDMDMGPMGGEGFPAGRYVMPIGGASKVSLVSEALEEADPKPARWLRKDFIKVESPSAISVNGQAEGMRWKVTRESANAEWSLAEAKPEEQLDAAKVGSLATILSSPSFKDVLAPDAKAEETGLDKPVTATIETFDGFTYSLRIGKLTEDAYPVLISVSANIPKERPPGKEEKPEDKAKLDAEFQARQKKLEEKLAAEKKVEGRPYLLEKFALEPLLKERATLLAEKKPEPATTSAPQAPTPPSPPPPVPSATAPPVTVTTPPVSATTPPLSAPPATPPLSVPSPAPPEAPTPPAAHPAGPTPPATASAPATESTPPPPAPAPAPPSPAEPVAPSASSTETQTPPPPPEASPSPATVPPTPEPSAPSQPQTPLKPAPATPSDSAEVNAEPTVSPNAAENSAPSNVGGGETARP